MFVSCPIKMRNYGNADTINMAKSLCRFLIDTNMANTSFGFFIVDSMSFAVWKINGG